MRYFKIIFVIFLVVLATSCKDNEQKRVDIFQETKSFFLFKTGSSWEYVNKSNASDIINFSLKNPLTGYTDPKSTHTEYFTYEMVKSDKEKILVRAEAGSDLKVDRISFITFDNDDLYYNPIIWYDGVEFIERNSDTLEWLDKFDVNGTTYHDVIHVKLADINKKNHERIYKSLYMAKGIGIIQFNYKKNDNIYFLKSHKVVK